MVRYLPLALIIMSILGILFARQFFFTQPGVMLVGDSVSTYYVSPTGNDSDPGIESRPFRTIERARDVIRNRLTTSGINSSITVYLRGGTYELQTPLTFTTADSGTAQYAITYQSFPGEQAIISGGKALPKSWTQESGQLWRLSVPDLTNTRSLFKNDSRLMRARFPNTGYLKINGINPDRTQFTFTQNIPDGTQWTSATDANLVILYNWETAKSPIVLKHGAVTNGVATVAPVGTSTIGGNALIPGLNKNAYVEGAKGLIDQAGEWYFDPSTKTLYYQAEVNENPNTQNFTAGVHTKLLIMQGTAAKPITNLNLKNLTFANSDWSLPAIGYNGVQANYALLAANAPSNTPLEAAITYTHTHNANFAGNVVKHIGLMGFGVGINTHAVSIEHSTFTDIGSNCITLGWDTKGLGTDWTNAADTPYSLSVKNNTLYSCGRVFEGANGIFANFIKDSVIANNHLFDLPYSGIALITNWNRSITSQRNNVITANKIHDVMKLLSDGGGIYTNGANPDSTISRNLIYDIRYPGIVTNVKENNNGIFLDNGSIYLNVVENIVYSSAGSTLRRNDNAVADNNVVNNFFDVPPGAGSYPIAIANATGPIAAPAVPIPQTPTNLKTVCSASASQAQVTWDADPVTAHYGIRLDDQTNGWTGTCDPVNSGDVCTTLGPTSSYSASISPDHPYNWWFHACNASGCAPVTSITFTCKVNVPPPSRAASPAPSPIPSISSSPMGSPTAKPVDFNNDGSVNLEDYNLLVAGFGTKYTLADYNNLVANFGK